MKTTKPTLLIGLVLIALALLLPTGCATAPNPESMALYINDARDIAELGTKAALLENSKLRSKLESTRDALRVLGEQTGPVSADDLVNILTELPLDGLQTPKGQIYVTGGRIIVRRFLSWVKKPEVDVAESGYIRQFAKSMADGMEAALK